jgi:uncharacterized membrane protein YqhA
VLSDIYPIFTPQQKANLTMYKFIFISLMLMVSCGKQRTSISPLDFQHIKQEEDTLSYEEGKTLCLNLIKSFETFSEVAYWDVDNWRGG